MNVHQTNGCNDDLRCNCLKLKASADVNCQRRRGDALAGNLLVALINLSLTSRNKNFSWVDMHMAEAPTGTVCALET